MEIPIEKRFRILCEITRAQHFAWREAALTLAPDLDPQLLVNKMWEITGIETAKAFLERIDPARPLTMQVAECIVRSSICMGEDATAEPGEGDEAFVRHTGCPWFDWHQRKGLLAEDQPGCDTWFGTTVSEINKTLGSHLQLETQCSLPAGGGCCLRRIWNQEASHLGKGG